jgi:hypothetical protein
MAPKALPSCSCAGACETACACRAAGRKCTKGRCTCVHAHCSNLWGLKAAAAPLPPPDDVHAPADSTPTDELTAWFAACHLSAYAAPLCSRLGLAEVPDLATVGASDLRSVGMKVAEEERFKRRVAEDAAAKVAQVPLKVPPAPPQPSHVPSSRSLRLGSQSGTSAPPAGDAGTLEVCALVVGVSTYAQDGAFPSLTNSRSDSVAVAAALSALPGSRVTLLENPPLATLRDALRGAFSAAAPAAAAGTQRGMRVEAANSRPRLALIYFAGHGLQQDGRNFLIPADFAAALPLKSSALEEGSVSLDDALAARR